MQVYINDGTVRELESWEIEALEAAQRAHDAAEGIVRQYSEAKAQEVLMNFVTNAIDIPVEHACRMVSLFPTWKAGEQYQTGWKVSYMDNLYTVLQTHDSQDAWTPDVSPSLFARVLPGQQDNDEDEEIGEWIQPDSTNPYMTGNRVSHNNKIWESLIDGNVWEPSSAVPTLWKEITDE